MQPFTEQQFRKFSSYINNTFGIHFGHEKMELLKAKLHKVITGYGLLSHDDLYDRLRYSDDKMLLARLANEITINKTDFFREMQHFDFISGELGLILEKNRRILANREIRLWSAGCSTGQEPYSLAMVLKEHLPSGTGIRILATDLSSRALSAAIKGQYPLSVRGEIPPGYLEKYFVRSGGSLVVDEGIRKMVTFREFNLFRPFPFKGTFDMVFCRNVMIYFNADTQQQLLDKLYNVITPGGLLFIGHSEGITGKRHRFQYIKPTIYMK